MLARELRIRQGSAGQQVRRRCVGRRLMSGTSHADQSQYPHPTCARPMPRGVTLSSCNIAISGLSPFGSLVVQATPSAVGIPVPPPCSSYPRTRPAYPWKDRPTPCCRSRSSAGGSCSGCDGSSGTTPSATYFPDTSAASRPRGHDSSRTRCLYSHGSRG